MNEEIKHDRTGKFITLTFSNEELDKQIQETGIQESNAVATIAVRRFLERWRKKYKKSVKHFLITELGHSGTERIHLHGILFTNEKTETIQEIWKYWVASLVGIAIILSPFVFSFGDRKSTRLNSSHITRSRMPSSA